MYLGASCYGHGEDDILEFSGFIDDDTYTNSEFLEFIHPWNEDLLYTYDTFDFDYCADVGYEFDPFETKASSGSSSKSVKGLTGIRLIPDKSDVKAQHLARKESIAASQRTKADIPIGLVTGITPISKLKEYSESKLSK